MGEVVIRLTKQGIERTIYWIVILLLTTMLIWSYMGEEQSFEQTPEEIVEEISVKEETSQEETTANSEETIEEETSQEELVEEETEQENQFSGEVTIIVTNVGVEEASSGSLRVTNYSVSINNGLNENFIPRIQAFAQNANGYLLRQTDEDRSPYIPQQTLFVLSSGEQREYTINERGVYLFDDPIDTGVFYRTGESFRFVVELVDESGEVIAEASRMVSN